MEASELYVEADAFAIADKNTGLIYDSDNIDEVHGIASLTKLMSAYVIFDKIEEDNLDVNTVKIPVNERAYALSQDPELSGVYFGLGDEYTLELMLNLTLVYSDNGAVSSIAEELFGTEEAMVAKMNEKAQELGMVNTKFYNVSGLTMSDYGDYQLAGSKPTDYNVSTAREMLFFTQDLLEVHPEIMDYVSKPSVQFGGYTLPSYNLMLPGQLMEYDGVTGMKTGSSNEAGYCFIGYYINPETQREYLSIILGADDIPARFNETAYMYNYVDQLEYLEVKKEDNIKSVNLIGAEGEQLIEPEYNYYLEDEFVVNAMKVDVVYNDKYFDEDNELTEDIPAGEPVLSYTYQLLGENNVDFINTVDSSELTIEFVAASDIHEENILFKTARGLKDFIKSIYGNIEF